MGLFFSVQQFGLNSVTNPNS